MMLTSTLISFPLKYYKEFVYKLFFIILRKYAYSIYKETIFFPTMHFLLLHNI